MANQNPNIERVLVGNENILRWDGQKDLRDPNATSPAQLIREIRNVKRNVKVPVSTAEPWHVWLHYPELAREVDYLAVHILPYWDEKSDEAPLDYLKSRIAMLKQAYPNKNIIVTEVGWPSNGAERAQPGDRPDQARDARRAGQERPRHGGVAAARRTSTTSWSRRSTSRGSRTTSKARRAATGACGTPTASRSSPGPARSSASRNGRPARRGRWRPRCR